MLRSSVMRANFFPNIMSSAAKLKSSSRASADFANEVLIKQQLDIDLKVLCYFLMSILITASRLNSTINRISLFITGYS